jgi:hypothetical protein
MSDEAMRDAMQRFVRDEQFRSRVRGSEDKAAAVVAAGYSLTDEERRTINGLQWDTTTDEQLIARVGTAGCAYQ